ncbi:MAG: lipopolysaccharide kinase InaA family protein [Candidatus Brocadiia bacterium]
MKPVNSEAFESIKDDGLFYLIRKGYQDIIKNIKTASPGKTVQGRGSYNTFKTGADTSAVIRQYKRGGLSSALLPDIFWGNTRAINELNMTEQAIKSNVPAPEILGIITKPVFGPLCQLWIITKEIDAPTLAEAIVSLGETDSPEELLSRKTNLFKMVNASIKKLHQAGILHRDLHIRNILVNRDKAYIIDFDGAKDLENQQSELNSLIRLNRSIAKFLGAAAITASDRFRFLKIYFDDNYFKANKKDIITHCLRNLRLHQIWWSIIGHK